MVMLGASGAVPVRAAPDDDWVTVMVCAPEARPDAAPKEAMPRPAPPEPTSRSPDATTSLGEATVPAEIWVDPVASWSTANVRIPLWVPDVTLAVASDAFDEAVVKACS